MPSNNAQQIRFAPNGRILKAPVGTPMPASIRAEPDPRFVELGYVTDDGVTLTPGLETKAVNAWQSAVPVIYGVESASFKLAFALMQFDPANLALYFASAWQEAADGSGDRVLPIPSNPDLISYALILEWSDAEVDNRLCMARAQVSEREALKLTRTDPTTLPMTFDGLDDGTGNLAFLQSTADTPEVVLRLDDPIVAPGQDTGLTGTGYDPGTELTAHAERVLTTDQTTQRLRRALDRPRTRRAGPERPDGPRTPARNGPAPSTRPRKAGKR